MESTTRRAISVAAVGIGAAIVGAALTYFAVQARIGELETRAADAEAEVVSLRGDISELSAREPGEPTRTALAEDTIPGDGPSQTASGSGDVARQYAYITKATAAGGVITLTLDYAEFLTGAEAAAAAAAAGDESPPPNDYYITNVNKKLREFKVASGAQLIIALGDPEDTRVLTAQEFFDAFVGDAQGVRDTGYWVTISGGKITRGEEQWLP